MNRNLAAILAAGSIIGAGAILWPAGSSPEEFDPLSAFDAGTKPRPVFTDGGATIRLPSGVICDLRLMEQGKPPDEACIPVEDPPAVRADGGK